LNADEILDLDELLDLVDDDDHVIEQLPRREVYRRKLSNFRVVNAFVRNARGQLWIPRRNAQKQLFPLHLDVTVGGHVQAGESYDHALIREAREEMYLELIPAQFTRLAYLTPQQHGVSAFMWLYEIPLERNPRFNTADFVSAEWLSPAALQRRLQWGERAKSDLPTLLEYMG